MNQKIEDLQYEKECIEWMFEKIEKSIPADVYILPSEWNEKNRILTVEYSPKPGVFSYDETPYWRDVINSLSADSEINEISIMKGAQMGATVAILEAYLGYRIDVAPCPILYTSADNEQAQDNMSSRIDSMIKTTNIGSKIKPTTVKKFGRKTGDTRREKEFPGGFITAMGVKNPGKLRQKGYKVIVADEIDEYAKDLKGQGSALSLMDSRTQAFSIDSKKMYISTPTIAGNSNIETLCDDGTKEYYEVPCPHCGAFQKLELGDQSTPGLKFERDENKQLIEGSVYYQCVNGCRIEEHQKKQMLMKGKWVATQKPKRRNTRSFQISSLYSNFMPWEKVIDEFLKSKSDKNKLKVFTNNVLGLPFKDIAQPINISNVNNMKRQYNPFTIPNKLSAADGNGKIVVVTCGVDVNGDYQKPDGWLAVEIKGHCYNGQTYSIAKGQIFGNTDEGGSAWKALEQITLTPILSDDDVDYYINLTAVDVGFKPFSGYHFQSCVSRVVCVAGDNIHRKRSRVFFKTRTAKGDRYTVDTVLYKNNLAKSLNRQWLKNDYEQPVGYLNFPDNREKGGFEHFDFASLGVIIAGLGYDDDYFKCLKAEIPIIEKDNPESEFGEVVSWQKIHTRSPNHFWDCMVYNFAALDIFVSEVTEKYFKIKKADKGMIFKLISEILEREKKHWH